MVQWSSLFFAPHCRENDKLLLLPLKGIHRAYLAVLPMKNRCVRLNPQSPLKKTKGWLLLSRKTLTF